LHTTLAGGLSITAGGLVGAQPSTGAPKAAPLAPATPSSAVAPTNAITAPTPWRNWSGIHTCQPASWQVPGSVDELADLMRRAFETDVLAGAQCGGRMVLIATTQDPAVITRILTRLGLPLAPGAPDPARPPPDIDSV
jgi:hypothetical protein